MQLLRKISRATVIGDNTAVMAKCLADQNTTHALYRVYGFATGSRKDTDIVRTDDKPNNRPSFGPWECLIGAFEAVNLETGEVFRSGQCFLPQFAVDMIAGQFGGDVERVQMAFEVGAKFDAGTPTKYTYVVAPLMAPSEDDPLSKLATLIPAPAAKMIAQDKKAK